jgi:hypothetical protein
MRARGMPSLTWHNMRARVMPTLSAVQEYLVYFSMTKEGWGKRWGSSVVTRYHLSMTKNF